MYDKVVYGLAGAAGVSLVSYKTLFPWVKYDLQMMKVGRKLKTMIEEDQATGAFLIDKFEKQVLNQPKKPFVLFEGGVYTYEYVDQQANRVANIVKSWGLKAGDTVAMMIFNEPAFVWTFLGLQKLGITASLINFNLRQKQLSHSVNVCDAKAFIVGAGEELFQAVMEEESEFRQMPIYFQGLPSNQVPDGYFSFDELMQVAPSSGIDPSCRAGLSPFSTACYIYTSGTTGMPKPSFLRLRSCSMAANILTLAGFDSDSILYTTLPLYHSSGGGIGLFGTVGAGLPKPVHVHRLKMRAISHALSIADLDKADVVYTPLPLFHSAGSIGLYSTAYFGLSKPVNVRQLKVLGMSYGLLIAGLDKPDVLYMVLPLYHSAGGGLGFYTTIHCGMPKPSVISHLKCCSYGTVMGVCNYNHTDIIYTTLPLYHSSGGGLGFFGTVVYGATMVLRRKFSASHFWEDCCRYRVTVIQYIGELFRYLLSRPVTPEERNHCVRAAFGNGLRKDIWEEVQRRFQLPLIAEFFGATEGTTLLFNIANRPGAVGRLSPLMKKLSPVRNALVKYNFGTAQPVRDKQGRCIEVKPGEKGLFIAQVPQEMVDAKLDFYKASKSANEKKIVRNAFQQGDVFFNFGDLLYMDKDYFVYFVDRIGDTFRWKGENVSTTEVANILTNLDFVHDANVYGVTIPGHDGRAGMVAITLYDDRPFSPEFRRTFWTHCHKFLASYARPLFIRLQKEATLTSTFKQRKVDLVQEGFDPRKVSEPLFYADQSSESYIPLDSESYQSVITKSKL